MDRRSAASPQRSREALRVADADWDRIVESVIIPIHLGQRQRLVSCQFKRLMRNRITEGVAPGRKAWIRAIVDRIEVDHDHFRIFGRKDVLERAIMGPGAFVPGVRTFVPKWRTEQDSNYLYHPI
ncbi:hypothetical protein [Bradyrhizobium sp.]|uniref:hypothetical protein n=1 Tax=Bradyrhizobium sp. TaxID=376 RepID=UPI0039E7250C